MATRTPAAKATTAPVVSRDEARDLYLAIYDAFALDIEQDHRPIVAAINERFGATNSEQTIVESEVNGGADGIFWQTFQTYDSVPREVAEAMFDDAWPPELIEVAAQESRAETGGACKCGCAARVASNRHYLPGHDARHAGQVARALLALPADAAGAAEGADLLLTLPTQALRDKALAQVKRGPRKTRAGRPAAEPGTVTIGRWTYPACRYPAAPGSLGESDVVERNTKRDGSGDWITSDNTYDHFRTIFVPNRER